ncbi:hypothetical protein [Burkholderia ubonensis]|uniref:hypothetical protein n=1 Tax=Burkholderia ubonensis TaxID=101571 RepID=UPI000F582FBD|nr:hypothetical protein [Burkholderia ubonensis]RQP43154.1 hypothetical protein DF155_01235 [Burkholderia ubonensis]RQP44054.1 hypothetical protein DF154_07600 [Burkholderia ubonensis]RQP46960.1 hypothetical protein DF156_01645 [Burkholderia ubonensis]RQP60382.1 hypothetical protein DF144_04265 [Burkholderia ubonensis]RQP66427.1 hypothetical protein DF151_02840 [Burkholderia ubonensis]
MSIQSYDIQIPPGGAQTIEAGGQIFDFLSSGSAFDQIQVLPEFQQGNVTLKLGQGFDAGKVVNRWFVKNPGTTAINGTVVLSTAGFRNFRITGDVNVLDGAKSRTLANIAYSGAAFVNTAAGQMPYVQLWNPAANPNRLVLEQIEIDSSTTPLTGSMGFTQTQGTAQQTGVAKRSGGTASMAICGTQSVVYSGFNPMVRDFSLQTNGTQQIKFSSPLIIMPGWAFEIRANNAAAYLAANFEWYEEANT